MATTSYFTNNGTWTCPLLVTSIIVTGCGGGQGGCGVDTSGSLNFGAQGGYAAIQQSTVVLVTPLTTYTVTIGPGGTGGLAGPVNNPIYVTGNPGGSTSLTNGSTTLFSTFGGGGNVIYADIFAGYPGQQGGSLYGYQNYINGYAGGTPGGGNYMTTQLGGCGGGAGPQGLGGNGGVGDSGNGSTTATNGFSGANNSGAGGGGGGFSLNSTPHCNGGSGGSGYLYITY